MNQFCFRTVNYRQNLVEHASTVEIIVTFDLFSRKILIRNFNSLFCACSDVLDEGEVGSWAGGVQEDHLTHDLSIS